MNQILCKFTLQSCTSNRFAVATFAARTTQNLIYATTPHSTMERTYFALWYRLHGRDRYLIWFSEHGPDVDGDHDGVAIAPDGSVPSFRSIAQLRRYAQAHDLAPMSDEKARLHNLDVLARWLRSKSRTRSNHVDCEAFLAAWNLFADLSRSVAGSFNSDRKRTSVIYGKLFWANMNWMAPPGECFIPYWRGREICLMHEVLADGLQLFPKHVRLSRQD